MARKEPFGPIWNYDDPEEKKGRKKNTIKELDRERGKRGAETETPPPEESKPVEEKHYRGMFEEERASHKMTNRKEKTIAVVVVVLGLLIAVLVLILRVKWQRQLMSRYMSAPKAPWSVSCLTEDRL